MEEQKKKFAAEPFFLILIFGIFLLLGYGYLSGHKLAHNSYIGYFASDAVQDAAWTDGIKETGSYKYFAPYTSAGLNDTLAWYAPLLFHTSAMFSYASGLEAHDSVILLVYVLGIFTSLVMYFVIKQYNSKIAILSIPLMAFMFIKEFSGGFIYGQWAYISCSLFVASVFWAASRIHLKQIYIPLAFFVSGIIFIHPPEFAFIVLFLSLFLIYSFFVSNTLKNTAKQLVYAAILTLILAGYFLLVLKFTAEAHSIGGNLFDISNPIKGGNYGYPSAYISLFGYWIFFMILGMLVSLRKLRTMNAALMAGLFMLFVGFSNYLGGDIGDRAFQNRFMWPVYLSIFFGIGLYFCFKFFIKEWKPVYSYVISIFITAIILFQGYSAMSPSGMIDKERLDGLQWFNKNSPKDSQIFFFYGDPYSQTTVLWLTKRVPYLINLDSYAQAMQQNKIMREYMSRAVTSVIIHRISFFKASNYVEELGSEYFFTERDICDYDYLVFDKVGQYPPLLQYNMNVASALAKNEHIKTAFSNDIMLILKNEKPGEDCIEQTK